MKIVMVCEFYNSSLEYQENILTKYYTKHKHDVTVITSTYEDIFDYYSPGHDNTVAESISYDGKAKIIKLKYQFNLLNKIRKYTSIKKILEEEKPDLIYMHDIIPNVLEAVTYIKNNPDCKMIMDYHADYSNSGKSWVGLKILHGTLRKWYLDRSRKYLSKIFPVVPAGIKFLHEIYKVPLEEMEILPLGADIDLCEEVRKSELPSKIKKEYGINDNAKIIITGGKLSNRKKTEILIKAFGELNVENKHLVIIGDASLQDKDYKDMLLKTAEPYENIHFTGWLKKDEIYAHLQVATIAVFPASQSILWQQAIAAGLPLIVGNTGEQSIAYLNLYNNIIILEKDDITINNFKRSIEEALLDDNQYIKMVNGAKKVSKEELDWNHLIEKTLRFNK